VHDLDGDNNDLLQVPVCHDFLCQPYHLVNCLGRYIVIILTPHVGKKPCFQFKTLHVSDYANIDYILI
jgi:hypothetical protein